MLAKKLLLFSIAVFIALVAALWQISHMLALSLVIAFTLTQISAFITTIYLHRGLTHKSLTMKPWLATTCRITLAVFTGIWDKAYVAVHRLHHAFPDKPGDPHSPYLEGFWPIMIGNVIYYGRAARNRKIIDRYASDIPETRLDAVLKRGFICPALGTLVLCQIMGYGWALLTVAIHGSSYILLSGAINAIGHDESFGYQNYKDNKARNVPILAWFTAGEGEHNNHHGAASSPKFSLLPQEPDPAWPVITLLKRMHLLQHSPTLEQRHSEVSTA